VLFVGIVAVANLSRRVVSRRIVAFAMTDAAVLDAPAELSPVAAERLRRSVLVEAAVALIVLAVTAVLVSEPRGKEALVAQYREPVSGSASLGGARTVSVTVEPGVHGPVDVSIALSGGGATQVTATATQQAKQLGPIPVKLTRERPGFYDGNVSLPVAGDWNFDLVVTTSKFNATTTDLMLTLH
jgi:copper transport protein